MTQLRHLNPCKLFRQHYSARGLWTTAVRHQELVHEQSYLEDEKMHLFPHAVGRDARVLADRAGSLFLGAARDCLQVQASPFWACKIVQGFCFKGPPLEKAEKR